MYVVSGFSRTVTILKAGTAYDFTVRLKADTTYRSAVLFLPAAP
jgi:hypothetical protein